MWQYACFFASLHANFQYALGGVLSNIFRNTGNFIGSGGGFSVKVPRNSVIKFDFISEEMMDVPAYLGL